MALFQLVLFLSEQFPGMFFSNLVTFYYNNRLNNDLNAVIIKCLIKILKKLLSFFQ